MWFAGMERAVKKCGNAKFRGRAAITLVVD
jgi:hypothetical protein